MSPLYLYLTRPKVGPLLLSALAVTVEFGYGVADYVTVVNACCGIFSMMLCLNGRSHLTLPWFCSDGGSG